VKQYKKRSKKRNKQQQQLYKNKKSHKQDSNGQAMLRINQATLMMTIRTHHHQV